MLFSLGQCIESNDSIDNDKIARLDSFLTEQTVQGFSGTVLISEDDNIVLEKGYGLADIERKIPNTEDTKFEIASISKLFTVVCILQLVEKGRIQLDSSITDYLGVFDAPKNQATVHQLLLHTAGLVPKGHTLDYDTKDGFLASVKEAPYESIPGEEYRYTNAGYILLAAIIENASGMSYDDYLRENILYPIDLRNTCFGKNDTLSNLAVGYKGNSIEVLEPYVSPPLVWGDRGPSGIITSVGDLQRFLQALDEERLIEGSSLQKMYEAQMEGEAYGFHVLTNPSIGKTLTRGGGLPHFESQVAWYKDQDIKVIILINNRLKTRKAVWNGIEKILFE